MLKVLLICAIALTAVECQRRRVRPIARRPYRPDANLIPEYRDEDPKPYSFAYETTDPETGTVSKREESSDGLTVRGSYSYTDADGVYRIVDYTADENGFNANVRTNEPGTASAPEGRSDPANTSFTVEEPPQAVVARYAGPEPRRRYDDRPYRRRVDGRRPYPRRGNLAADTYNDN